MLDNQIVIMYNQNKAKETHRREIQMRVLEKYQYEVGSTKVWLTLKGPEKGYKGYGNGTSVEVSHSKDGRPTDVLDTRYESGIEKSFKEWGRRYLECRFGTSAKCLCGSVGKDGKMKLPEGSYRVDVTFTVRYDTGATKSYRTKNTAKRHFEKGFADGYGNPVDVIKKTDVHDVSYVRVM